jgi:cation diffusion facilitator family transporter
VKLMAGGELPEDLRPTYAKARRLEIFTLVYMVTAATAVYVVLGSSQAMKAAFFEDLLSMIPPAAFLIAGRFRHRRPDEAYPYGHHRSVDIGYLVSAVALLTLGGYLIYDSVLKLVLAEHPPIGLVEIGDGQVWLGWLMLAVIAYTGIPPVILGRMKLPLAEKLHDKVLHADAEMNRADWMTAGAAALGIVGIGLGWWWADSVAALAISIDIVHDGVRYTKAAISDLEDSRPTTFDEKEVHPLVGEVRRCVAGWDWIEVAAVRMRESGHLLNVEVLAVPRSEDGVLDRVEQAVDALRDLDWKLTDVVVSPVKALEDVPPELLVAPRP